MPSRASAGSAPPSRCAGRSCAPCASARAPTAIVSTCPRGSRHDSRQHPHARKEIRMTRIRVGILVFPQVEVLDFCGPFEVFSVTRLDEERRRQDPSPFEVLVVAEAADVITATGGLRVLPDCTIDGCPPLDILVVPGGWGTRREIDNR